MSTQQVPVTLESILETLQRITLRQEESARRQEETDRQMKDTDRRMKETDRRVGGLSSKVGLIIENMIYGDIVSQFQELGYEVSSRCQNKEFGKEGTKESGEIDLLLEDGDVAILIEAKTTLKTDHVLEHIERLEKYRRFTNARNRDMHVGYIGAVAGAVVANNVIDFAHANGLYVIVQTARDVKIVETPEGFKAKKW
jgi:hypothetical protein